MQRCDGGMPSGGVRVFPVSSGVTARISNLTIQHGNAGVGDRRRHLQRGTLTLTNSTLTGNTAQWLRRRHLQRGGTLTLKNTIVAGNTATSGPDIGGSVTTTDHNLLTTSGGGITNGDAQGDIVTATPLLGSLASNGGTTQTIALLAGSPAIGAGDPAVCAAAPVGGTDQRGVYRQAGVCSIGAFEAQPAIPKPLPPPKPPGPPAGVPANPLPVSRPTGPPVGPAPNPLPPPRP